MLIQFIYTNFKLNISLPQLQVPKTNFHFVMSISVFSLILDAGIPPVKSALCSYWTHL